MIKTTLGHTNSRQLGGIQGQTASGLSAAGQAVISGAGKRNLPVFGGSVQPSASYKSGLANDIEQILAQDRINRQNKKVPQK